MRMVMDHRKKTPLALLLLVALNLVPLVGVLYWGWQSFELIFLYWMENVVIGAFTLARMVVRPYQHPVDWAFPVLLAPFFTFHYGMFTWIHGSFVVLLFGPENLKSLDLLPVVGEMLSLPHMLTALAALAAIQGLDWLRDVRQQGFGSGSVRSLMAAPYRRIVVLHLTILAAGVALATLNEPTTGLIILVLLKTGSDVYHWRRDSAAETGTQITEALIRQMAEKYPEPRLSMNGREMKFASFSELRESSQFRMLQAIMRLVGGQREFQAMSAYMDQRIAEERSAAQTPAGAGADGIAVSSSAH